MRVIDRLWPGLWRDLVLNGVFGSPLVPMPLRWRLLRLYGLDVERSLVSPKVWFGSRRVSIGRGTFINYDCMFNTAAPIRIGANCSFGMGVRFITSTHALGSPRRRAGAATASPITVGDGVWIGAGAIVLPGVEIGAGAVVAAGAVVTLDCEPDHLYAGVPAKIVRALDA